MKHMPRLVSAAALATSAFTGAAVAASSDAASEFGRPSPSVDGPSVVCVDTTDTRLRFHGPSGATVTVQVPDGVQVDRSQVALDSEGTGDVRIWSGDVREVVVHVVFGTPMPPERQNTSNTVRVPISFVSCDGVTDTPDGESAPAPGVGSNPAGGGPDPDTNDGVDTGIQARPTTPASPSTAAKTTSPPTPHKAPLPNSAGPVRTFPSVTHAVLMTGTPSGNRARRAHVEMRTSMVRTTRTRRLVRYTIVVRNTGNRSATGVRLRVVLPRGTQIVRRPTLSKTAPGSVDVPVGRLAPGARRQVFLSVRTPRRAAVVCTRIVRRAGAKYSGHGRLCSARGISSRFIAL